MPFQIELTGLILQVLGLTVAVFGLIGEWIFEYGTLEVLERLMPEFYPVEILSKTRFRLILGFETAKDKRLNNWQSGLALFAASLLFLLFSVGGFVYIAIFGLIPLKSYLEGFSVGLTAGWVANVLFESVKRASKKHEKGNRKNWLEVFMLQLVNGCILMPLRVTAILFILILQMAMHWVAWITQILPKRNFVDLTAHDTRQKYYGLYGGVALLIGTILVLVALILKS